jgi:hypothetical protein
MGDNPVSIIPSGIDAREVKDNYCDIFKVLSYIVLFWGYQGLYAHLIWFFLALYLVVFNNWATFLSQEILTLEKC